MTFENLKLVGSIIIFRPFTEYYFDNDDFWFNKSICYSWTPNDEDWKSELESKSRKMKVPNVSTNAEIDRILEMFDAGYTNWREGGERDREKDKDTDGPEPSKDRRWITRVGSMHSHSNRRNSENKDSNLPEW